MTLALDTSTAIRSLARYRELVLAVYHGPNAEQETNSVEWKTEVDLAEKRWQAELGRQVLGMANRDPESAGKVLGGCGYILLGVSPGELPGTPPYDTAKIESWISPYVGQPPNGPEWAPTYVEILGQQVLVLTVEPPRFGHPAWPCRKEYSADPRTPGATPRLAMREGAVYVRHKASTREATAGDIEMLSRRAASSRRRMAGVSLHLAPGSRAAALDLRPEAVATWEERERHQLEPPPPEPTEPEQATINVSDLPKNSPLRKTAEMLAQMSGALETAMKASALGPGAFGWEPDRRTEADYAKEVDDYIAKVKDELPGAIIKASHARGLGRMALVVRNDTDDPIHGLQVEVHISGDGVLALDEDEIPKTEWPSRPVMLGEGGRSRTRLGYLDGPAYPSVTIPRYGFETPALRLRRVRIDNSNSVHLTFDPLDLYPEESTELEEVWLFVNAALAGTTLMADWSARSRDASGVLRDTLAIEVDAFVPSIDELLAETVDDEER